MKTGALILLFASFLSFVHSVLAQGTVLFRNNVPGFVNAPMFESDGVVLLDEAYVAQLYAFFGTEGFPVGTPVAFGSGLNVGYFFGGNVVVPGVAPGQSATVEVRFWNAEFGSFEAAAASGTGKIGFSNRITVTTGGGFGPGRASIAFPSPSGALLGLESSSLISAIMLSHGLSQTQTHPSTVTDNTYQPQSYCSVLLGSTKWFRISLTNPTNSTVPMVVHTAGTGFDTVASICFGSPVELENALQLECNDDDPNQPDPSKRHSVVQFTFTNTAQVYFLSVSSKAGDSPTGPISVTVLPWAAPQAMERNYSVPEDGTLSVMPIAGLMPVAIPDASVANTSLPSNGNLTVDPKGSFIYTPRADYHGSDGFTFQISDGVLFSEEGTVIIDVTPIPDAARLQNIRRLGESIRFQVAGGWYEDYQLEVATSVAGPWIPHDIITLGEGPLEFQDELHTEGAVIYRAVSR